MSVSLGIQNLTGGDITIGDLGLVVPASSSLDLTGSLTPERVRSSFDLQTAINANQVVVMENGVSIGKNSSLTFVAGAPLGIEAALVVGAGSNTTVSGIGIITVSGTVPRDNLLINGGFRVNQRRISGAGYTSSSTPWLNNNASYTVDRWILLSDGNNAVNVDTITLSTPVEINSAITLTVVTANKKFGILQAIEFKNTRITRGKPVSLQFKAKITGTTINALRAGILSWTGTDDVITRSAVSAWNGAGSNPTLAANWAFLNTPGDLTAPTASLQTYTIENTLVPTSCDNLAVFIWTDDVVMSAADILTITEVKLEIGESCTEYREIPFTTDLLRCERHFCKTMDQTLSAENNVGTNGCLSAHSSSNSSGDTRATWRFPVQMVAIPTITTFNPTAGTAGAWDRAGTAIAATANFTGTDGVSIATNAASSADARHNIQACAEAEL